MSKILKQDNRNRENNRDYYIFECPGCKCAHSISVPGWTFDGNYEAPTISPSILVKGVDVPNEPEMKDGEYILGPDGRIKGAVDTLCHSFVKNGMIQFLNDCTHELKGQTVPLEDM